MSTRHLSEITTDLMTDVVRLEQHRRIKRRTPVKQRKSETHLKRCTDKFCEGGYPNALDYLFAVSHATDNITQVLDNDDDEEKEEYNVEDYSESSSPSPSAQTVSDSDNLCDICWSAERAKEVFVACGHSRFCQACAYRCFGSANKKMCGMQSKY